MRLIWDKQARSDLISIREYIAADNPSAARRVAKRIQTRILTLAKYPRIGRVGRTPNTREFIIAGLPYIGIYRLDNDRDTVEILRVVHAAQLYPPEESS